MEKDTKKILTLKTIDKRMTESKSGNMEKFGFQAAMEELSEKDVKGIWCIVLHHIVNEHEWILSHSDDEIHQCHHGPFENKNKPWPHIKQYAHVLKDLAGVVMDKCLLKRWPTISTSEDMYNDNMEPEPDYFDETDVVVIDTINANKERTPSQSSEEGIILPKKLPNPCIESPTRQALHKELLLNYKRGVNVLEKPELNKVLQNRRETQRRKEWQEQASSKRTSLEMKLEQRATRLKEDEMKTISEKDESEKPELQKAFAKFAQKANGKVK